MLLATVSTDDMTYSHGKGWLCCFFPQTRIGIGDISVPLAVGPLEEQFIKSIIRILAVALNPPHSLWAIDCFSLLSVVININTVKDKTLYHAFKQDKLVEVVANGNIPQAAGTFIIYY